MKWNHLNRWWTAASAPREVLTNPPAASDPGAGDSAAIVPEVIAEPITAPALDLEVRTALRAESRQQRIRRWRQRALMRKGARLYSTMSARADIGSLAMLDEDGIVVAWYGGDRSRESNAPSALHCHVSQFYVPADVALDVPRRHLANATMQGCSTRTGWRRAADGTLFWATTVIQPIRLRDGRMQGFSHVIRPCAEPTEKAVTNESWSVKWLKGLRERTRLTSRQGALDRNRPAWRSSSLASRGALFGRVAVAMCALFVGNVAAVTAANTRLPDHSLANAYGSGWECERGYRRVDDACTQVTLPANAYLDASGSRWRCERGFINANERCVSIKLPANAYLDDSFGTGWRCERGYRESRGVCTAVSIPAHAYPTDSFGLGWECERGYIANGGACVAVAVPAHGYLTRTGNDWKCDRGFVASATTCVAINVPANGYLDLSGNDWTCNRGFQRSGLRCAAVVVPANAHLDYSGDRWRCDRGYNERNDACLRD